MNSELIEKLQKLIHVIRRDLGTTRTNELFREANLRPIEIKIFMNFKTLLDNDGREAYEKWLTELEAKNHELLESQRRKDG